ncbi:hypothetical protein DB346_13625 [Verrucomicrobia bacterium LW23]|nr:hypothetical protein DB346_13625 [Verrucomicrobia bacterium LW23]
MPATTAWEVSARHALQSATVERLYEYRQQAGIHPVPSIIPPHYMRPELMTGGRGWVFHQGTWREVLPGDLIWSKPGETTIGRSDHANPYRCLAVTVVTPLPRGPEDIPRFAHVADLEAVRHFTQEVVTLFRDDTFDRDSLRDYVLARLLFWIRVSQHQEQKPAFPAAIEDALLYMEKHYAEPCTVADLARRVGWSAAHFHDTFRRSVGTTPHKLLARHRLRAAREMLISTSHPVKRIAADCGFADASALIHAFRADTRLTPSAYRKRYGRLELGRE